MKPRTAISWSGGKDSYLALHRSRSAYDVVAMVTMFNEDWAIDVERADAVSV